MTATSTTSLPSSRADRVADRFASGPTLDSYHERVRALVDSVPAEGRVVVRRYARWSVTGPLQRKVDNEPVLTTQRLRWPLAKIKVAARFTIATLEVGISLAEATQSQLDSWIAEFPSHRPTLRAYVNWCSRHAYMARDLEVPATSSREVRRTLDDEQWLILAQRLMRLSADNDDPAARFAGLLVVLFGQTATSVAATPTDAVQVTPDRDVTILLGQTPLRLREPMARLALHIAADARRQRSPWLFASKQRGSHLSAERLSERMRKLGVPHLLLARNAARASLAVRLPPALLADRLGVSITAAVQWAKAVGAARGTYTGLRMGGSL